MVDHRRTSDMIELTPPQKTVLLQDGPAGDEGEAIDAALETAGLRPDVRAEDVSLADLEGVARQLNVIR